MEAYCAHASYLENYCDRFIAYSLYGVATMYLDADFLRLAFAEDQLCKHLLTCDIELLTFVPSQMFRSVPYMKLLN